MANAEIIDAWHGPGSLVLCSFKAYVTYPALPGIVVSVGHDMGGRVVNAHNGRIFALQHGQIETFACVPSLLPRLREIHLGARVVGGLV